ncbi:MAG: M20/M25/M40 family metallo-hydrolase [Caldilineaceae bacterium]|nr:M20/M25/M40 family metallo-hydrolase [Caldilineaceae bacterium]
MTNPSNPAAVDVAALDVIPLTQELVAMESESQHSNAAVSDRIAAVMRAIGFEVERLAYDDNGVEKVNIVGKLGQGAGGLGLFGHSDVVPGGDGWQPYVPEIRDGRLYGRGSCDMKGPVAAMLVAAARVDPAALKHPLFIAVTSDEEVGHTGARIICTDSTLLGAGWPTYCVVGEPTELVPVYAHKGGYRITVTAHGVAAHTSTDRGVSANFLIAPFLAEMAELAQLFKQEPRFMNQEFDPPTNGFNMVLDDGGAKPNVTAAKTVCTLALRAMPDANIEEAVALIEARARAYGFDVESHGFTPFYVAPDADVVRLACRVTGHDRAQAVPYGTEAVWYQAHAQTLVLGPGNIAQAHTRGEWIDLDQLTRAVDVYADFIRAVCLEED